MKGIYGPISRFLIALFPPALADEKTLRQLASQAPKPTVRSQALAEWLMEEAARRDIRGPKEVRHDWK